MAQGSDVFIESAVDVGVKDGNLDGVIGRTSTDGSVDERIRFTGKRIPSMPESSPDLSKVRFGLPILLFNGKDLTGWRPHESDKINGWSAQDGMLVNTTTKTDFSPTGDHANLRTEGEFEDFWLHIEFLVEQDRNSGIYLRGMYEAQVVDRDSRMQGMQGPGRDLRTDCLPSTNAGKDRDRGCVKISGSTKSESCLFNNGRRDGRHAILHRAPVVASPMSDPWQLPRPRILRLHGSSRSHPPAPVGPHSRPLDFPLGPSADPRCGPRHLQPGSPRPYSASHYLLPRCICSTRNTTSPVGDVAHDPLGACPHHGCSGGFPVAARLVVVDPRSQLHQRQADLLDLPGSQLAASRRSSRLVTGLFHAARTRRIVFSDGATRCPLDGRPGTPAAELLLRQLAPEDPDRSRSGRCLSPRR